MDGRRQQELCEGVLDRCEPRVGLLAIASPGFDEGGQEGVVGGVEVEVDLAKLQGFGPRAASEKE